MHANQTAAGPPLGFAIASLVLGILAVVLGLFLVGGLLGIAGLICGLLQLRKPGAPKAMAGWGAGLSLAGLLVACLMVRPYVKFVETFRSQMAEATQNAPKFEEWQGKPAPDFTVTALDGQKLTLSALKGKRVVLDFWATWCPPCVKEIPHFVELTRQTSRDELVILGISSESETKLKTFVEAHGMNYPVVSASNLPAPFSGLTAIPTTFFIDRNGIIQDTVVGYHDLAGLKSRALAKDWEGAPKPAPGSGVPGT